MKKFVSFIALGLLALAPVVRGSAAVQYGLSVSSNDAKRILAAAEAEAVKNQWNMVIVILDTGGHLVAFLRMDGAPLASVDIAQGKAYTAVAFGRPSKSFQDSLATGGENLRILKLPGVTPAEGGLPLIVEGKVIGSIGVSGATSAQDAQVGAAGAAVLK